MSTERKTQLSNIMLQAWQFVKRNGFSLAEALRLAWLNAKLVNALRRGICQFFFSKVDGTMRQAFGTLKADLLPPTTGTGRKPADSVQVYFDTEKGEYRCFKKCNLVRMA